MHENLKIAMNITEKGKQRIYLIVNISEILIFGFGMSDKNDVEVSIRIIK